MRLPESEQRKKMMMIGERVENHMSYRKRDMEDSPVTYMSDESNARAQVR